MQKQPHVAGRSNFIGFITHGSACTPRVFFGIVVSTSLLLNACTLGPDFTRPAAPTTSAYLADETTPALAPGSDQQLASGAALPAQWWMLFNSADLNAVIQQALDGNRSLDAAAATLMQAREAVNATAGMSYPQLSVDAGAGRQKYGEEFGGPINFPPFSYFAIGPKVSYLFDYLGSQRRSVEQQRALAEVQACQLDAARINIVGQVLQQVFTIASTRGQIAAVETVLDEDRKNVELVQREFEVGSTSRVDLLSAQSQLANDQTQLPPLRQQLSVAQHALAVLGGRAPADFTPPSFDLAQLQLPANLPLSLPSELVHHRPDILAAEAQLHAATAAVGIATANLYPQITLSASAGEQAAALSHLFDASSLAWGFAGDIAGPLFDGGTRRAQRRSAQAALRATAANYQQTVIQAFGQVADVLTALEHDAESLAAQTTALQTADANLQLTRESYRVGNSGLLQVLDADRLLQQARLGVVRAQAQRYVDTAQLFLALGNL